MDNSPLACLSSAGLTLATAESCTGGLIADRIVSIPGASAVYLGGVVSYATEIKHRLLGVSEETVAAHSVVSSEVACEMAEGACRALGADMAVSSTGYAGPTGDSVGLVYIGISGPNGTVSFEEHFSGSREDIRRQAADAAMWHISEYLRGSEGACPNQKGSKTTWKNSEESAF